MEAARNSEGEEDEAAKRGKVDADADGAVRLDDEKMVGVEEGEAVKKREPRGAEEGEAAMEIVHEGGRETGKADRAAEEKRRLMEEYAKWKREKDAATPPPDPEKWEDYYAFQARSFEQWWTGIFGWHCGSFNDETKIPCMLLTNKPGGSQHDT